MSKKERKITLYWDQHEPLELAPAPAKYKEFIKLVRAHYKVAKRELLLSYFNYKVWKFCTIDSHIGYTACCQGKNYEIYIAVTLPEQVPKFNLPEFWSKNPDTNMYVERQKIQQETTAKSTAPLAQTIRDRYRQKQALEIVDLDHTNQPMCIITPKTEIPEIASTAFETPSPVILEQDAFESVSDDAELSETDNLINEYSNELKTKKRKIKLKAAISHSVMKRGRNFLDVFSYMKKDDIPLKLVRLFWKMTGQLPEALDAHLDDLNKELIISQNADKINFINCPVVDITHKNIQQLENALVEMFTYDDNDPTTYQPCQKMQNVIKNYLYHPLVKMKRLSHNRLQLLLKLGEFIYAMESKPYEAVYPFEQAVELASILYPSLSGSCELATAHEWLGRCYLLDNKIREAALHFQKSLEVRIDLYGEKHPDVAQSWHFIGNSESALGNKAEALQIHSKAMEMKIQLLGRCHWQVALSQGNFANDLLLLGDLELAVTYMNQSLESRIRIFGEHHPRVADIYFNMGGCYLKNTDLDTAVVCFDKARNIREDLFGEHHYTVGLCHLNKGRAHMLEGKFDSGKEHIDKAKNIFTMHLGVDHPKIKVCDRILGKIERFEQDNVYSTEEDEFDSIVPSNRRLPPTEAAEKRSVCCILF